MTNKNAERLKASFQGADCDEGPFEGRPEGSLAAEKEGRCPEFEIPWDPQENRRGMVNFSKLVFFYKS